MKTPQLPHRPPLISVWFLLMIIPVCLPGVSARETRDRVTLDRQQVWEIIRSAPAPDHRDVPVRYLHRRIDIHLKTESLIERTEEVLIEILNEKAKHDFGDLKIRFDAGSETVRILCAETYTVDGNVIPIMAGADNEMVPPDMLAHALGGDQRIRVLAFSGVAAGSVLHYAYTTTRDCVGRDHFIHDAVLMGMVYPVLHSEVTICYPETVPVQTVLRNGCPEPEITGHDGLVFRRWVQENISAIDYEWGMPTLGNIAPRIDLTTARWDALGEWFRKQFYWEDTSDHRDWMQWLPDAGAMMSGSHTASVDACYRFVTDTIQWQDISPEVRSYRPSALADVLQRRYGDAVDKARLMTALLAGMNLPAAVVFYPLEGTRGHGDLPSLHGLSGVAVMIPRQDGGNTWLDMSTGDAPTGWFFSGDAVDGIRFQGTEAGPVALPVPLPGQSYSRRDIRFTVTGEGAATGTLIWQGTGAFESRIRHRMQDMQTYEARRYLRKHLDGAVFPMVPDRVQMPDWYDYASPPRLEIDFSSQWAGQPCSNMIILQVPDIPFRDCRRYMPMLETERQHPVVTAPPELETLTVTIVLPPGYETVYYPGNARISGNGFGISQRVIVSRDTIMLRRQFRWTSSEFLPEHYAAAIRAYTRFTGESENVILLRKSSND